MLDDDGVDFLGMRLAVVLITAALLLSLAAVYVNDLTGREARERARQEAFRIAAFAEAEYAAGAPGSTAPVSVSLPNAVRYVAFVNRTFTIEFQDGSREVYTADCRFSPATLYPGYHRLGVELVANGGVSSISLREA
jgi:hypothetical protein